jgi:hypothetical protein
MRQMREDRKLQLEVEALNREEAGLSKDKFQDFGIRTPEKGDLVDKVIREPGKAPKDTKAKAGLKDGTGTGKEPKTKAGLKTETEGKGTKKETDGYSWGKVDIPESLKAYEKQEYNPEVVVGPQKKDESDTAYFFRKLAVESTEGEDNWLTQPALGPYVLGEKEARDLSPYYRDYYNNVGKLLRSNPTKREQAGFSSRDDVRELQRAQVKHSGKITRWFAEHPGAAPKFKSLPLAEQVQTIKAILSEAGAVEGEVTEEAKVIAEETKKVKEAAGLPATSAIEEEVPNEKKNIRLVENPGKPRERWADTLAKREELARVYQEKNDMYRMLVQANTPASRLKAADIKKEGDLLRTEGLVLEAAAKKYENLQALQDWRNSGDPRHLQGRLSEIFDGETHIQPLDNGNYNILVRDAETGEFVVQQGNVTEADLSTSFQRLTDESFDNAYQALILQSREAEMEFQRDLALERVKGGLQIDKEVAKAKAGAQYGTGEDAKPFNAYLPGGDRVTIRKEGGQWKMLQEGVSVPGGGKSQDRWVNISGDVVNAINALNAKKPESN